MRQFFASDKIGDIFLFSSEDNHHIKNVLRLKDKKNIQIIYSEKRYDCHIFYDDNKPKAKIIKKINIKNELKTKVVFAISLLKADKIDFLVQKLSELGIYEIILFESKNSVVSLDKKRKEKKLERWNKIALSASKQSNREKVLKISKIINFNELKKYKQNINVFANEYIKNENKSIHKNFQDQNNSFLFIVGPEGGFSLDEVYYLKQNDFIQASLGKRILRSETAVLYLASIASYFSKELNDE